MKMGVGFFLGLSIATISFMEAQAQVKAYVPELSPEEALQDASGLSRDALSAEITAIQDQLNDLRAEALRQGDVDTLQEITFVIRYGERAKDLEDLRLVKKEKERLERFLVHIRAYLQEFANK